MRALLLGPSRPAAGELLRLRLDSLTGLRFFAAFLVLQHHFTNFGLIPGLARYTGFGATGVTFFFVLSGFVLTWSFIPSDTAPRFYWRRFARIWPLHAVSTLVAIPVFYTWRDIPLDWTAIVLSFALLHAWVPTATTYFAGNPASWSLSCEMFFYALHPLFVRRLFRLGLLALGAATALLFVATYVVADQAVGWPARLAGWLLYISPLFRLGEFVLGMAIAAAVKRRFWLRIGLLPAVVLLGGWFILYYDVAPHLAASQQLIVANLQYIALPALYGLVILAAAQLDLAGVPSPLRTRPMILLGEWSYALYLFHASVIYTLIHWIGPRPYGFANVAWLVGVSAVCIAISSLLYRFVEHPIEARLRGLLRRRPSDAFRGVTAIERPATDHTPAG